ncbi:MAG: hypothetical protein QS721_01700 [Candidatus Endonucleobacter sp. (ex Gigantidas childressi)]|nr:hypothetical protein [Candidatus Endonucleobacter sp. (ex Gigantidas childressi)]
MANLPRIGQLQGSTSNSPMLSRDVASWATNNSPTAFLTVILKSLKDTEDFINIKNDLKNRKPKDIAVVIAAAGQTDKSNLNRSAVQNLLDGNDILYSELRENKDTKNLLETSDLTKPEGHAELYRLILSEQLEFEFKREQVFSYPDSDFMTHILNVTHILQVGPHAHTGLWMTTYAMVVHFDKGHNNCYLEQHGNLPASMQKKGLGGMFQLGQSATSEIVTVDKKMPIVPVLFRAYANYMAKYTEKNTLGKPPLTPISIVKRLRNNLGFVNFGEFISELSRTGSLNTTGARDPIHTEALAYAQEHISSAGGSLENVDAFCQNKIETVKKDAITKFLHALWSSDIKVGSAPSVGVLLGEYSDVFFKGEKRIALGDYLENDSFVDEFIRGFDKDNEITNLKKVDEQRQAVRSHFKLDKPDERDELYERDERDKPDESDESDESDEPDEYGFLIVIPQTKLLGFLHAYGCSKF